MDTTTPIPVQPASDFSDAHPRDSSPTSDAADVHRADVDVHQQPERGAADAAPGTTNEEKRAAVDAALQGPETKHLADREIARRLGVSQPFVSSRRAVLSGKAPKRVAVPVSATANPFEMHPVSIHRELEAISREHPRVIDRVIAGLAKAHELETLEQRREALARALPVREAVARAEARQREQAAIRETHRRFEELAERSLAELVENGRALDAALADVGRLVARNDAIVAQIDELGALAVLVTENECVRLGDLRARADLEEPIERVLSVLGVRHEPVPATVRGLDLSIATHAGAWSRQYVALARRRLPILDDDNGDDEAA